MQMNSNTKTVLAVIILVIAVIGIYYFSQNMDPKMDELSIRHQEIDLSATENPGDKLPVGFPVDMPFDLGDITESYSSHYDDAGFVQHTVSYSTTETLEDVHNIMTLYMFEKGYEITDSSLNSSLGELYGVEEDNDLSVVMTSQEGQRNVTINYLQR